MKKLFAILLALVLVLSLTACGGGNDDKTPSSEDKTPSSTQQQEDKTPEADPAPVEDEQPEQTSAPGTSEQEQPENSEWSTTYSYFTEGVPEPEFAYTISSVDSMTGMTFTFDCEASVFDEWKQELLDSGFTLTPESGDTDWTMENGTYYISKSGELVKISRN